MRGATNHGREMALLKTVRPVVYHPLSSGYEIRLMFARNGHQAFRSQDFRSRLIRSLPECSLCPWFGGQQPSQLHWRASMRLAEK
jgi:hypothetical protein